LVHCWYISVSASVSAEPCANSAARFWSSSRTAVASSGIITMGTPDSNTVCAAAVSATMLYSASGGRAGR